MIPTIRTLLDRPALDLRLRAGQAGIDRAVKWVAVSELEDPTPYLDGGELVLTTGLRLEPAGATSYIERLGRSGVAGLGLGVGLTHSRVPHAWVEAADRVELALLEVPEPTPFISIAKTVSEFLAASEYEAVTRTVEAQRDLTRAALAPDGASEVVAKLAVALGGRALLLDAAGALIHAAPRSAAALLSQIGREVDRLRERGPRSAAAFTLDDGTQHVFMQPLAAAGRVRGFLTVMRTEPLGAADVALANVGAALVSLALERSFGTDTSRRELRAAVFALLVDGVAADQLPITGVGWGELFSGSIHVLMADGPRGALLEVVEAVEQESGGPPWRGAVLYDERAVVISSGEPDAADGTAVGQPLDGLLGLLGLISRGQNLAWGVSDAVSVDALGDAVRQARRALAAAGPGGTRRFGDLARHGLVGLLNVEAGRGFADGLLGPLEARDRGDLVASVRAWLAHHGQWDAAASSLGVHRHTLRYRMKRVEELLDRPLDDPDLRAELWVALAVRDRDAE